AGARAGAGPGSRAGTPCATAGEPHAHQAKTAATTSGFTVMGRPGGPSPGPGPAPADRAIELHGRVELLEPGTAQRQLRVEQAALGLEHFHIARNPGDVAPLG